MMTQIASGTRRQNLCSTLCFILLISFGYHLAHVQGFSTNPPPTPPSSHLRQVNNDNDAETTTPTNNNGEDAATVVSRREVLDWPFLAVGTAVVTGELLSTIIGGLSLSRPAPHEQRVAETIRRTLLEAAASSSSSSVSTDGVLRVLEVGIGSDCRLIRRGLYNQAISNLAKSTNTKNLAITGIDLQPPKDDKVKDAQLLLDQLSESTGISSKLQVQGDSITSGLAFESGYFDAVICCLTLCSVSDPEFAVAEIRRLIRPSGGTFGYVEHVAVNQDEPYRFLEWQQTTLDPLQQALAENCHLHRYTQSTIYDGFNIDKGAATILQQDRFLVDKMWPVSSQSCGVIQLKG